MPLAATLLKAHLKGVVQKGDMLGQEKRCQSRGKAGQGNQTPEKTGKKAPEGVGKEALQGCGQ
jgi:hypothetical protein